MFPFGSIHRLPVRQGFSKVPKHATYSTNHTVQVTAEINWNFVFSQAAKHFYFCCNDTEQDSEVKWEPTEL